MSTRGRVAVTGASGMLGRHLVRFFHGRGWAVHALMRRPESMEFGLEPGDSRVSGFRYELGQAPAARALEGVDVLVHCAAVTRASELAGSGGRDVEGARVLFRAVRESSGARILFASSTSASGAAASHYGRQKYVIEGLLDPEHDVALRLGLVLSRDAGGLFERMVDMIQSSRCVPLFGGGRQSLQPIHVEDVCRAFGAAAEGTARGTLTVADPEGLELRTFLRGVATRLGRRIFFVPLPYAPVLFGLGLIERLKLPFPISSENLLGLREQRHHPCADDLAQLGLTPMNRERALDLALSRTRAC